MRFHHCIAPGQKFHAHAISGFQHLALRRTHLATAGFAGIEKVENVGFVEAGQFAQCSNRSAHLRAFQRAEESSRDADSFRYLNERKAPLRSELPQMRANGTGISVRGWTNF